MPSKYAIIERTKKWISQVVVGCNFCPFAARELRQETVHWEVQESPSSESCLQALLPECERLDNDQEIATSFLIFPNALEQLDDYLDLVARAERLIKRHGYRGVYQLASFHPLYRFADKSRDDPANYTNRSIYPMLHLLREDSISQALHDYPNPEQIWERNVEFSRKKGLAYMKMLRDSC